MFAPIIITILFFIISICIDKVKGIKQGRAGMKYTVGKTIISFVISLVIIFIINFTLSVNPEYTDYETIRTYSLNPLKGQMNSKDLVLVKLTNDEAISNVRCSDNSNKIFKTNTKNSYFIYNDMGTLTIEKPVFKNKILSFILRDPIMMNIRYNYNIPERTIQLDY